MFYVPSEVGGDIANGGKEFVGYILHHLKQHSSVISSCLLLLKEDNLTNEERINILNFMETKTKELNSLEHEIKEWLDTTD